MSPLALCRSRSRPKGITDRVSDASATPSADVSLPSAPNSWIARPVASYRASDTLSGGGWSHRTRKRGSSRGPRAGGVNDLRGRRRVRLCVRRPTVSEAPLETFAVSGLSPHLPSGCERMRLIGDKNEALGSSAPNRLRQSKGTHAEGLPGAFQGFPLRKAVHFDPRRTSVRVGEPRRSGMDECCSIR